MAVTWTKTSVTNTNPFDNTSETVFEVNNVQIDSVEVAGIHYTFTNVTSDATIQSVVETDLIAKGYQI